MTRNVFSSCIRKSRKAKYFFSDIIAHRRQQVLSLFLQIIYYVKRVDKAWPPVPPPRLNFNQSSGQSIDEYIRVFATEAIQKELPFLKKLAGLNSHSVTLDFGCGLGRLASAYATDPSVGKYFGYEPERLAREWLKSAYAKDPRFSFGGGDLPEVMNYVTNKTDKFSTEENFLNRSDASCNQEALSALLQGSTISLQYSCSVFTHMWMEDIIKSLQMFDRFSDEKTIYVNTWLIVDDHTRKALESGKTDRQLPISINGVYTYSETNPLVCTAYPIHLVEKIYADAGHQIEEILFGSWSGRDNGVVYQDIVVSKKLSK